MGEPMLPQAYEIGNKNDEYNKAKLEILLNEGNCFDIDLALSNNDILELNFTYASKANPANTIHLVYEFIYKKNKWILHEFDPFYKYKLRKHQGKINNPFF